LLASVKSAVFFCVLGAISSRGIQLHLMATHFYGTAESLSVIRRIQRFLKEQVIDYLALARGIMSILPLPSSVDIVIDRTNWQFGSCPVNFLVLSVSLWGKQAIPLFWKALPKKGASCAQEQCDLLQSFMDVFGCARIQSLTADREFISNKWLAFLHAHSIPFYIRLRQDRTVDWDEVSKRPLSTFFSHLASKEKRLLHKDIAGLPLVIAGTRSCDGALVLVTTNQTHLKAANILNVYRRRWTCEPLFRNTKTAGLNLEDTHVKSPDKLEKLMAITAVAIALCVIEGQQQESRKATPYKQTVQAPLYSTFRRGFDALRKWLGKNGHIQETNSLLNPLKIPIINHHMKSVV
jgi:hypothetical protein